MKTLNLVNSDKSDIKYKISKFPDGQQNIVIEKQEYALPVTIKSRLNNWLDLELITCTVASLRELGVEEIHLYTPYIMGTRSDRKFEDGGNNYLKDVICPIINSLNFKTVTCIDPHSDVLEACLNNYRKQSNLELVKFGLSSMLKLSEDTGKFYEDDFILVSPDAGANKKIYKLAEQIGYKGDIITCSKDRDKDGKLIKTIVTIKPEHVTKDLIIIDDICDGGGTFINIAKFIDEHNKNYKSICGKKYLIVTHGIFSKGFEELSKYFDGIYCTNSYSDLKFHPSVNDIIGPSEKFVKQLNVF